jgi:Probable cobalt transporter subunit (CbtB)
MAHTGIMPPVAEAVPISIPIREWWPWALFTGVIAVFLLYILGLDQGATALFSGEYVHEFVHDARHLLGFPCH